MSSPNYSVLLTLEVILNISTVSGRTGNYAPKCWAMVDFNDQESEGSIKVHTTKRTAPAIKALGNGALAKVLLKLETANVKKTFDNNGKPTEYYETMTKYTVVKVIEVLEQGTMPEPKAKAEGGDTTVEDGDVLPG